VLARSAVVADLDGLRIHDLRHTAVALWIAASGWAEPGVGDRAAPGCLAAPVRPRNEVSAADVGPTTL
jgi:hypothetical protein